MTVIMFALTLSLQASQPTPAQIQEWFEAGEYQQVADAASGVSQPTSQFWLALSLERLDQPGEARRVLDALVARGDDDVWASIGRSARALVDVGASGPSPEALDAADTAIRRALELLDSADDSPEPASLAFANFQLGQVLTYRRDYEGAARAFDQAVEARPSLAYAHYYAGMSYREIRKVDLMALRFDRFLELAPEAPERTRVQAIMRTVRGR